MPKKGSQIIDLTPLEILKELKERYCVRLIFTAFHKILGFYLAS